MTTTFDVNTPGVSEAVLIVATLLVEMKEVDHINDARYDVLAAKHPTKDSYFPIINFRYNNLFSVLVGVSMEEKTYGVALMGYPVINVPPIVNIPRESEGLKNLVKELIEKERASWV